MFSGVYIQEINQNKIELAYDLKGQNCRAMCIEESNGNVTFVVCLPGAEDMDCCYDEHKVLSQKNIAVGSNLELPKEFMDFVKNDNEVVVLGVGDRIEVMRLDCYEDDMTLDSDLFAEFFDDFVAMFGD